MPAYVIANVHVHDPDGYEEYRRLVPATIDEHGGRYLARAGETVKLEGDWEPRRVVVVEFPSLDAARRWYESASYTRAREIRQRTATTDLVITEGF